REVDGEFVMATRTTLFVVASAALAASLAACGTPNTPSQTATSATPAQPSPAIGTTRVPCELLTPSIARQFVGDDAVRQQQFDSDPPLPVGDNACFYKGTEGSVILSISAMPGDP